MANPVRLASFGTRPKRVAAPKAKTARRKKIGDRWFEMGKYSKWNAQCFRCARFKATECYRKDADGDCEPFCKNCCRIIDRKMNELDRKNRFPDPTVEVKCGICSTPFLPKQRGENPIIGQFCPDCRAHKRTEITKKSPLDEAYAKLYPHLKEYGHKSGDEIKSEGLAGPTYFDLTRDQREKALILAKELIYQETKDKRWIHGHERSGQAQLYKRGANKSERKTA